MKRILTKRNLIQKKDLGGVDVGVSSVPAAGLGLRTLEDEKKELQAKLASYRAKRLQKDQEDENELSGMIANMKNEQNARAKKWKNDDDEGGKNLFEKNFLEGNLIRNGIKTYTSTS